MYCGATLIGKKTLLTAAHCALSVFDWAYVGSLESSGTDGIKVRFRTVVNHPDYYQLDLLNDYALVELDDEVTTPFPKIELNFDPGWPSVEGELLTSIGQGITEDGTPSDKTLFANFPFMERDRCEAMYEKVFVGDFSLSPTDLCAGGGDACGQPGDSGGPLVKQRDGELHTLVGVASWGLCGAGFPLVFQDVSAVRQWIVETACGWERNRASFCPGPADSTLPTTESSNGEDLVLEPDADTFIWGKDSQATYGNFPYMAVQRDDSGESRFSLIKFDLAGVSNKVVKAELHIDVDVPSAPDVMIEGFKVKSDWNEDLTYESFEANDQNKYSGVASFTIPTPHVRGRKTIDVTADVQDWIDGKEDNFGWIFQARNARGNFIFLASDYGMDGPRLFIRLAGDCSGTFADKIQLTKDALNEAVESGGVRGRIMSRIVRHFFGKVERYFDRGDFWKAERLLSKIRRFMRKKLKHSTQKEAVMEAIDCLLDTVRNA